MEKLPVIKLGDFTLQIELDDLSPEVEEIARKELRENPDTKKQAIVALRDLLKGKELREKSLESKSNIIKLIIS